MAKWHRFAAIAAVAAAAAAGHGPARPAYADVEPPTLALPAPPPADVPAPSLGRRLLAVGAAIVPGPLLVGGGSVVLGERRTARSLSRLQQLGLGVLVVAGLPQAATYGSRRLAPTIPILLGGAGLWLTGWFGDLFMAAGGDASATSPRRAPRRALTASTILAIDPLRGPRTYAALDGEFAFGATPAALRLRASVWASAERAEQRVNVEAELPLARRTRDRGTDDSHAALLGRVRVERNLTGDVDGGAAEVAVRLHLDGARVAPPLRGTFAEADLGLGLTLLRYSPGGVDVSDAVVARLSWGRRLGDGGELRAFYDHRRDGLAGGVHASRATGFIGSVGASAIVPLAQGWDVVSALELGSAVVVTAGIRRGLGDAR